jgi:hypothetical protein
LNLEISVARAPSSSLSLTARFLNTPRERSGPFVLAARDSGIPNEFQQIPLTTTHEHAEHVSRPFGDSIGSIQVFVTSRRGISVANRGFAASRARVCRELAWSLPQRTVNRQFFHCLFI